jgi:hypothetical protein
MSLFIKPNSIETYLSGITRRLQPFYPDVKQSRDNPFLKDVIKGLKQQHNYAVLQKEPVTFKQLNMVARAYQKSQCINDALFLALLTTGFFGLLCLGELVDPNDPTLIDQQKTTCRNSISHNSDSVRFTLPASKTDKYFQGNHVLLCRNGHENDPVDAMNYYLSLRDAYFPDCKFLWLTAAGNPPTRRWFMKKFHLYFDARYGGHSLRAGGATLLAKKGVSFDLIQAIGRWSSDAFRIYVRQHPIIIHSSITSNIRRDAPPAQTELAAGY